MVGGGGGGGGGGVLGSYLACSLIDPLPFACIRTILVYVHQLNKYSFVHIQMDANMLVPNKSLREFCTESFLLCYS